MANKDKTNNKGYRGDTRIMIKLNQDDVKALHNAFDKMKEDISFLTYFFQSNETQISEEQLGKIVKDARVLASNLDYIEWRNKTLVEGAKIDSKN